MKPSTQSCLRHKAGPSAQPIPQIGVYLPHPTPWRGTCRYTALGSCLLSHGTLPHIICIVDGAKRCTGYLGCSQHFLGLYLLWVQSHALNAGSSVQSQEQQSQVPKSAHVDCAQCLGRGALSTFISYQALQPPGNPLIP